MTDASDPTNTQLTDMVAKIVSAYVMNNSVNAADLPGLIKDVHAALVGLGATPAEPPAELVPAVSIRKSITPDYLICLDDGKRFKSLKRHLTQLGMTPDEYRHKWNLPRDYPMVAPNYSAVRSGLAKTNGLGRKPADKAVSTTTTKRSKAKA
jgi:predicted transcriptional regulator